MKNEKLYLSISHYNDSGHTVWKNVFSSRIRAAAPVSLQGVEYNVKYSPAQIDVYEIDLEAGTVTQLSHDNMSPPSILQCERVKNYCTLLNKSYNKPRTAVEADTWLECHEDRYREKMYSIIDGNAGVPATESQVRIIKMLWEELGIKGSLQRLTKGSAFVEIHHLAPYYVDKLEESVGDTRQKLSDLRDELEWK